MLLCVAGLSAKAQAPSPAQEPGSLGYGHDDKELQVIRQPLPSEMKAANQQLVADRVRMLEDIRNMQRLLFDVRNDLAKGSPYVVSLETVKKMEKVEKTAKSVRARMKTQ